MAQDFLTTYKYGWKTSYYQNTYDIKTDEIEEDKKPNLEDLLSELSSVEEGECESCAV
jgi:ribonucleoside-diphosphate reductase alpha chain